MDYVTASSMEWMEMDARTIHFHAVDTWIVDVEWIASLILAAVSTSRSLESVIDCRKKLLDSARDFLEGEIMRIGGCPKNRLESN